MPGNQSPGPAACFTVEPFSRTFRTVLLGFYMFFPLCTAIFRPVIISRHTTPFLPELAGSLAGHSPREIVRKRPASAGEDDEIQVRAGIYPLWVFATTLVIGSTPIPSNTLNKWKRNAKSNLFGKYAIRKRLTDVRRRRWSHFFSKSNLLNTSISFYIFRRFPVKFGCS